MAQTHSGKATRGNNMIASTAHNTVHKHTFIEALFHGCVQFLLHAMMCYILSV